MPREQPAHMALLDVEQGHWTDCTHHMTRPRIRCRARGRPDRRHHAGAPSAVCTCSGPFQSLLHGAATVTRADFQSGCHSWLAPETGTQQEADVPLRVLTEGIGELTTNSAAGSREHVRKVRHPGTRRSRES